MTSHTALTHVSSRQRLIPDHLDADALQLRLQSVHIVSNYSLHILTQYQRRTITPPPDDEEDDEECRMHETQARQDLESDGCPPCYPPHLDVPLRNPPEEYRQIVEYWQSFSSTGDVVLCAQRSDWRGFRESQRGLRYPYQNKPFSMFVDDVRERRRRHRLDDNVELLPDPQQQSREQTWVEFQDYHLRLHESQRKKRDGLQKDLDDAQMGTGLTDREGAERAAQHERATQQRLEFAERTLRWHEVMLWWIEQRRLAMDPRPPTPVEKGSGNQNSLSIRQRRSKRRNTPAVLGKVRVSKSTPHGQDVRTRTFKAPACKSPSVDSAVTIPSSIQQMPECWELRPRRAKEKALSQLLSQKVAKASRGAETRATSQPRRQCSGTGQIRHRARPQRQSATQRLQSTPRIFRTRSRRISREPVRWAPE